MNKLRTGVTTGACAAAAAKAAVMVLLGQPAPERVTMILPDGEPLIIPVLYARPAADGGRAVAAVRKDAGDDPDVTDGLEIVVTVEFVTAGETVFTAGDGVGTVSKPGLQVPPGEPAINPVPRRMIAAAMAEVTPQAMTVEVAIPGGREVATRTFNPRLGIVGGLSILGTTGIVRPHCMKALRDSLKCSLDVAAACGVRSPVLVPGHIGARAVRAIFALAEEQVIEVGNEWGYVVELAGRYSFASLLAAGHPGKLAKLAAGEWDTHSARSGNAAAMIDGVCREVLGRPEPESPTAEGVFAALEAAERKRLGDALAAQVAAAVARKTGGVFPVAALLVNMAGVELGRGGDFSSWR
jgi:cobalt-precorrin-5B (C1)-methyltransferase